MPVHITVKIANKWKQKTFSASGRKNENVILFLVLLK